MIFVPLLHYFQSKNTYSGNEEGMRYLLTLGKRKFADAVSGAEKEENILTVDVWPDPWAIDKTDPALRRQSIFPLSEEGRAAAADFLRECYRENPEYWRNRPSILDCDPWEPPAPSDKAAADASERKA